MKPTIFFLIFFSSTMTFAAEEWLCTSQSSQVHGNQVYSCGVGLGADENGARTKAFDGAKSEFNRLCEASTNCRGKTVSINPKRTTCETTASGYKCYRLLVYTIFDEPDPTTKAGHRKAVANYNFGASDYWEAWRQKYLVPHQ